MFEFIAGVFALGIAAQIVFWIVAGVLFPLFWFWMVLDAALRRDDEYPSRDSIEKVVWILGMAFVQPLAVLYFFLVYRRQVRGPQASYVAAPPASPVAPAA